MTPGLDRDPLKDWHHLLVRTYDEYGRGVPRDHALSLGLSLKKTPKSEGAYYLQIPQGAGLFKASSLLIF